MYKNIVHKYLPKMYENVLKKFCLAFTVLNLALKWISEYVCVCGVEEFNLCTYVSRRIEGRQSISS